MVKTNALSTWLKVFQSLKLVARKDFKLSGLVDTPKLNVWRKAEFSDGQFSTPRKYSLFPNLIF